jgi:Cytochrome B561, N terminal.
MSEFRWNSGGSLHSKEWEEHLPTDSAVCIVLQLFMYTVWLHEVALPQICVIIRTL